MQQPVGVIILLVFMLIMINAQMCSGEFGFCSLFFSLYLLTFCSISWFLHHENIHVAEGLSAMPVYMLILEELVAVGMI